MKSRIQIGLGIAVCAALVVIGVVLWVDRMTPVTVSVAEGPVQNVSVDVRGAVATPGVVHIPGGSRLQHAVDAAGGFTQDADLAVLNLAGRVGDGERIEIPSINAAESGSATPVPAGDRLNINTASADALRDLPGIGDVLSERIVDYREQNGPYETVEELQLVDGISPRMVEELRPLVTVSGDD